MEPADLALGPDDIELVYDGDNITQVTDVTLKVTVHNNGWTDAHDIEVELIETTSGEVGS